MVLLKFYICSTSNMFDSLMLIPFHIDINKSFIRSFVCKKENPKILDITSL